MLRFGTALALAILVSAPLAAQKTTPIKVGDGGSPHVRTDWTIEGSNISIEYGRPSLKGRVPGTAIDPYDGKEWRTGADEATTLKTSKALKFGKLSVPAGTYTLYTIPVNGAWQLIVSKKTGQWGIPYPGPADDLGRAPMTVAKNAKPAEMLTISIEPAAKGGTLIIDWGATRASIPFTVG